MEPYTKTDNRAWTGVFLVIVGLLWLAYMMGAPLPHWIFTWQMLVIGIGLLIGVRHNFRNTFWIILVAVGSIFLLDEEVPDFNLRVYISPIIIIAVGLMFILRPRRRKTAWWDKEKIRDWADTSSYMHHGTTMTGDDFIDSTAVFSGVKKTVLSKNFKGGDIVCVFGGCEIDLTQADIQGKAVIDVSQVFGGTKLIVPPHWLVRNDVALVFAGIDDKRVSQNAVPDANKMLVITGTCAFAGIEIRSF